MKFSCENYKHNEILNEIPFYSTNLIQHKNAVSFGFGFGFVVLWIFSCDIKILCAIRSIRNFTCYNSVFMTYSFDPIIYSIELNRIIVLIKYEISALHFNRGTKLKTYLLKNQRNFSSLLESTLVLRTM